MTDAQIIVLATPVFLAMIAVEFAVGLVRGRNTYRLNDALNSIGIGILSQVVGLFTKLVTFGIYAALYSHVAMWKLPADSAAVWIVGLLLYDLLYYFYHRFGHTVAVLWAAHAVHHQSEDYNLSTALRQTGSGWLLGWIFYLPMAVLGFPPLVFGVVAMIDLLYQYWVHTQQVGRLGWFDRWFCSPSNHRVHHAVNDRYLDRNFGGILVVWDRLFGSFTEEDDAERCVYGTRSPLRSWNPLWANFQVYASLWREMQLCSRWSDKLKVWAMPPGWRAPEVLAKSGPHRFDLAAVRRFDPPLSAGRQLAAGVLFLAVIGGALALMWNAHRLGLPMLAAGSVSLVLGLVLVGRICTPAGGDAMASTAARPA